MKIILIRFCRMSTLTSSNMDIYFHVRITDSYKMLTYFFSLLFSLEQQNWNSSYSKTLKNFLLQEIFCAADIFLNKNKPECRLWFLESVDKNWFFRSTRNLLAFDLVYDASKDAFKKSIFFGLKYILYNIIPKIGSHGRVVCGSITWRRGAFIIPAKN